MKIQYDKEVDALYIEFKKGRANKTIEKGGNFLLDVDKNGKVMGIEILNYSKSVPSKERLQISAGAKRILIPA